MASPPSWSIATRAGRSARSNSGHETAGCSAMAIPKCGRIQKSGLIHPAADEPLSSSVGDAAFRSSRDIVLFGLHLAYLSIARAQTPNYGSSNPSGVVPVLELDDGTSIQSR